MPYPTPAEQIALNPHAPVLLPEYFSEDCQIKDLKEGNRFCYSEKYYIVKSNTRFNSDGQFAKKDESPLYLECINIPSGKKILGTLNLRVKRIPSGFKIPAYQSEIPEHKD
jgi:hypothetical protein